MYLLDTNVVSELRKVNTGSAHPQVKSWAKGLDAETTFLSVITLLELEQGILSLEHRDPRQEVQVLVVVLVPQPAARAAHELHRVAHICPDRVSAFELLQLAERWTHVVGPILVP